jgi:hypothetical protein
MCRGLGLLTYCAVDTHLHFNHTEDRAVSGELAHKITSAIRRQLAIPVGFGRAYHRPILDQAHLGNSSNYILDQQPNHGLEWDPYHETSNLPDLLGLRVVGAFTAGNVRALLPRVTRAQLVRRFGIDELAERAGPPDKLVEAASAALALPGITGRGASARAARRALLEIASGQLAVTRTAELIGCSARTLDRIRAIPPDQALVRAIRLQLGLRQAVAEAATGAFVAQQQRTVEQRWVARGGQRQ